LAAVPAGKEKTVIAFLPASCLAKNCTHAICIEILTEVCLYFLTKTPYQKSEKAV
jgi:hypothetical protein